MARELLANYGHLEFHEALLELLGTAAIRRERVSQHLAALTEIFDAATRAMRTPFVFASDISEAARTTAIDASLELIGRGYHREAMFWIAVTHCRCQKVLSLDAPANWTQSYQDSYQELVSDMGVPSLANIRQRCTDIQRILPRLCDLAKDVIAANPEIEDD
jgi:hypothetical protein